MENSFYLGILKAKLFFRGCRSLKDRRGLLVSLKARLGKSGFEVVQTGPADLVKMAWIAAVCISRNETGARGMLEKAHEMLHDPRWELLEHEMDIIGKEELSQL